MTKDRTLTEDDLIAALPNTSGNLKLTGLDGDVEIYRDRYGIPHVRASTVHDAFFGQGSATAQDRLWHMDHDRRVAYGRWAEYAGSVAVEEDVRMRRFQLRRSVEADYVALNAETRAMLDAYAAGVNAFIETTASLPIEYRLVEGGPERWAPWDCIAVFKARHILMGVYEAKLWRAHLVNALGPERAAEVVPDEKAGGLMIVPPGALYTGAVADALDQFRGGAETIGPLHNPDDGSNNWVLSGSRTASGKPLLAGDPHRGLDTPNVYYQNHIACPEFDAIGLSFPGCPGFPHFGHNAYVAWCVTHASADYQDLYIERFKKGSSSQYESDGGWKEADVSHEVIEVRDGDPVELDVAMTHHGPIIQGSPSAGYGVAFKYTATSGTNPGLQCLPQMLRARNADELDESMRDWVDPCNNFVFADVHGDIAYLNRGRLPVRSRANAWLPVPGWTGEHEWDGFVPFEELARIRNPGTGYIVTANNRIVGEDYPHYINLSFGSDFRARRVTARVEGLDKATVRDMSAVHAERLSIPAQTYIRLIETVEPIDDLSARAKEALAPWDGTMDRDSAAAAIYSAFRLHLNRTVVGSILGPIAEDAVSALGRGAPRHVGQIEAAIMDAASEGDTSMLPPGADWDSLLAKALAEGVAYLKERMGDDLGAWEWGKVHHTRPQHTLSESFPEVAQLLDPPSVPMGGDGDTPHSASYRPTEPFVVTGTSVSRYVFDLGDWDNSAWISPLGASGHPGSPHYSDQTPIWADIQLVPMLYDWGRIEKGKRQGLGSGV